MSDSVIPVIRDLSIVFLALESIVVLILLSILIVQLRNLIVLLNEEIRPMLQSTQETADTVRTTTTFVSKRVAKPFVDVISFGAGVRQAARTLGVRVVPGRGSSDDAGSDVSGPETPPPGPVTPDEPPASAPPPPPPASDSGLGV